MRVCCRAAWPLMFGIGLAMLTVASLNTGVIGEFPDVRFVSIPLLGVSYWGQPLPWLKQVVYPGAPKQLVWPNLLADIVFWAAVLWIAKLLYAKLLAKPRPGAGRKARRRRRAGNRKPKRSRRR